MAEGTLYQVFFRTVKHHSHSFLKFICDPVKPRASHFSSRDMEGCFSIMILDSSLYITKIFFNYSIDI